MRALVGPNKEKKMGEDNVEKNRAIVLQPG
jgi:hypothetical protein